MIKKLLFFFCLIVIFISDTCIAKSVDILKNGSFERKGSTSFSSGWGDNSGWANVDVSYKKIYSKERKGFVQEINCTGFRHGAVQFVQPDVDIKKNTAYRVTFWAKGDIRSPLNVLFRKHGSPYTSYFSKAFKVSSRWKKYSFTAPVTVSDSSAYFMFRFTSKGKLLLDDVSVMPVVANARLKLQKGNFVKNGSFEVGTDKWGVQFRGIGYENEMPVRDLELKATSDASRSKFGRYSLKIPSVKNARFLLTSENMVLSPGSRYSLSLWVYSETERHLRMSLGSGYFGQGRAVSKTIHVGPAWKHYTLSMFAKPAEENAYFISIAGSGDGAIWVDGVQLVQGKPKPFVNKSALETGFDKQKTHPLFLLNGKIPLTVHIASHTAANNCRVKIDSTDYYGVKKTIYLKKCTLKKDSDKEISLLYPSNKLGYFRLMAEIIQNGKVVDSSEYAIGVIPKLPATTAAENIKSPFGGHGTFNKSELVSLSKLGIKWLRMHPPLGTKWSVVEKNKGHFKYYDKGIKRAKNAGFEILGSLDRTPRWASTAPETERRFWSYPPKNLNDWENYVYNIVHHYRGVINYWEVWNEPGSDGFLKIPGLFGAQKKPEVYVELLKRAYRAAKKANPNAVIVGGCAIGKPPSRWLKQIFDKGALNYMDIVSFHYYTDGRPGDALDSTIGSDVKKINKFVIQKIGRHLPIWETESGILYPETSYKKLKEISPAYAVPANEAVAYLVRNFIHLLSNGVDKWFYYSMFTSHRIDRREATGFFEWDGAPRPLAVAYAVLADKLSGLVYSAKQGIGESVVATKFSGIKLDVLVVWSKQWVLNTKHQVKIKMSSLYSKYNLYNAMGNKIKFTMVGNKLVFNVGREPVYIVEYKNKFKN